LLTDWLLLSTGKVIENCQLVEQDWMRHPFSHLQACLACAKLSTGCSGGLQQTIESPAYLALSFWRAHFGLDGICTGATMHTTQSRRQSEGVLITSVSSRGALQCASRGQRSCTTMYNQHSKKLSGVQHPPTAPQETANETVPACNGLLNAKLVLCSSMMHRSAELMCHVFHLEHSSQSHSKQEVHLGWCSSETILLLLQRSP
jgi:hypothetical protein